MTPVIRTTGQGVGTVTSVIRTAGLTKEFRGGRGVHNVNLEIKQGQVFGFLGPNGAGKSTFVKMLVGLLKPTAGVAQILGLPAGHIDARKRIGYLPELFRFQEWLTAEEVLWFHARLNRLDKDIAKRRISQVIRDVGLEGRARDRVRNFSKGMQQRLGLACALLPEPDVLFLDEPASALDPGGRHEVRQLLLQLGKNGMTVFLNTHLLEDVESICTEVALLIEGTVRALGTVNEILNPEPIWDFSIGGWAEAMSDLLQDYAKPLGISVRIADVAADGSALLEAKLTSPEQAAWLNAQLVDLGVSVYMIQPRKHRLESWFLALTEGDGRSIR